MDGGILFVPTEETQEFHQACVDAINSGTKLYVVEQKTELFKFFVDLDYKAQEKLKDEDLLQFCSIIHESLGGDKVSECFIAKARPRSVGGPQGTSLIKSGVHIHWPRLIVTRTEAINLRSKLIQALGEGPWDTIIDASVYVGSGLRMLWSHKKPTGDPYIPWRQLNSTREFSKVPSEEILELGPLVDKWRAFGWDACEIDGHDLAVLNTVMGRPRSRSGKPIAVVAHTVKGKGVSFMEDDNNWHYKIPNADELVTAYKELGLTL
jgi:hypothetical protein